VEVRDKIAIVTGASSGIGLATARLLTGKRAKVALVARSKDKLEDLSKELPGSVAIAADMTNEQAVRDMVEETVNHYGRLDILINNAGRGYDAPLEQIDTAKFRELFQLDVIGPLVAMQAAIPIMRNQGGGVIVNVSSGTSLMHLPNMSAYASVKRALNAITLTAREELARDNIKVSVVYPYMTLTDFDKNMIDAADFVATPEEDNSFRPPDRPEHVAQRILETIRSGAPEVFAHDWMKSLHQWA
jgi:NAD(P)-dependent dehydrogenase (short-subunit alcohol dehydrogenase family)